MPAPVARLQSASDGAVRLQIPSSQSVTVRLQLRCLRPPPGSAAFPGHPQPAESQTPLTVRLVALVDQSTTAIMQVRVVVSHTVHWLGCQGKLQTG